MRKGNRGKFGRNAQQIHPAPKTARSGSHRQEAADIAARLEIATTHLLAEYFADAFRDALVEEDLEGLENAATAYEFLTGKSIFDWVTVVESNDGMKREGGPFMVASASKAVKSTVWLLARATVNLHPSASQFVAELAACFEGDDNSEAFNYYCEQIIEAFSTPLSVQSAETNLAMLPASNVGPKVRALIERFNRGYLAIAEHAELGQSIAPISLPMLREAIRL